MSEGPLSGDTPTEKAAGKIIRPASTATSKSMMEICKARLEEIGLTAEVRSIGTDTAHTHTHRIEPLSQGIQEHVSVYLSEIRLQQELHALTCIRQQTSCYHNDQKQDEQERHHHLRSLLYTAAHTMNNHEMTNQDIATVHITGRTGSEENSLK